MLTENETPEEEVSNTLLVETNGKKRGQQDYERDCGTDGERYED
jgi:hypothetical protein